MDYLTLIEDGKTQCHWPHTLCSLVYEINWTVWLCVNSPLLCEWPPVYSCMVRFLTNTVSNNFQYKQVTLKNYSILPIYTRRIDQPSDLNIPKVHKTTTHFKGIQKQTKMHNGNIYKRHPFGFVLRMFGFIQPRFYASTVNKTSKIIVNNVTQIYFVFTRTLHIFKLH